MITNAEGKCVPHNLVRQPRIILVDRTAICLPLRPERINRSGGGLPRTAQIQLAISLSTLVDLHLQTPPTWLVGSP